MNEVRKVSYSVNDKDYEIFIQYDEDALNPRESEDSLGSFIMFHRKYDFSDKGEKQKFRTPEDFQAYLKEDKCVVLPVYMLDHSNITIRTYPFNDDWDSGKIGYIYVTYEKIKKEYNLKVVNYRRIRNVKDILRREIDNLDMWLRGEIYGYIILDEDKKPVDSCWGFTSSREALDNALEVCNAQ